MEPEKKKFTTIDEYLASFPKEVQAKLNEIRKIAREIAPEANEVISYQIGAFKVNKTSFVHYAGFAKHISLFPAFPDTHELMQELKPYLHGKATIRFDLTKPLPLPLIKKFIKARFAGLPQK